MNTYSRRRVLVASACLVGSTLLSPPASARRGPLIRVYVERPETLQGLTGKALHRALQKQMRVRIDGSTEALPVSLCAVRVERGRAVDVFLSEAFKALPGDMYLPGDRYLPDAKAFTQCLSPGMYLPGDMYYPPSGIEKMASDAAVSSLREAGSDSGLFMVGIATAGGETRSRGTAIPSQAC